MSKLAFIQFQQQEILNKDVTTQENQQINISDPLLIKEPAMTFIKQEIDEIVALEDQQNNTPLITEGIKIEPSLHTTLIIKDEEIDEISNEKIYKCNICDKRFTQCSGLSQHKKIHSGEKPFICDICDKAFNRSYSLVQHKRIHTGEKPYSCDICDKKFPIRHALVQHKRIHTGDKPYKCNLCDKAFNRSYCLVQHKRIHAGEKSFSCDICYKAFSHPSLLSKHKKRIHSDKKPYSCDICKKAFNDGSNLIQHKRIHFKRKFSVQENNLSQHSQNHFERDIKIEKHIDPEKIFIKEEALEDIVPKEAPEAVAMQLLGESVATEENPQININRSMFIKDEKNMKIEEYFEPELTVSNQEIKEGIISVEVRENNCNLSKEEITFVQNPNRTLIIKNEETNEISNDIIYKCNICDKIFTQRSGLSHHKKIHSGEKPHSCDVCDKKFSIRHNLVQHKRIHTGEKPFICDLCDKAFNRSYSLVQHKRIHTGEKPYSCDICNKIFTYRCDLVKHNRSHNGEKPF